MQLDVLCFSLHDPLIISLVDFHLINQNYKQRFQLLWVGFGDFQNKSASTEHFVSKEINIAWGRGSVWKGVDISVLIIGFAGRPRVCVTKSITIKWNWNHSNQQVRAFPIGERLNPFFVLFFVLCFFCFFFIHRIGHQKWLWWFTEQLYRYCTPVFLCVGINTLPDVWMNKVATIYKNTGLVSPPKENVTRICHNDNIARFFPRDLSFKDFFVKINNFFFY